VIRRAGIMLGVPLVFSALVAVPLGLWKGEYQWLCAAVAAGLVVPPGLATLVLAEKLAKVSAFGPLMALAVGTAVRLFVGFGGAVAVFFASKPTFHGDPFSYFGWLLGTYLVALVTETALLAGLKAKADGTAAGAPPRG
jgi:hypothetical protein